MGSQVCVHQSHVFMSVTWCKLPLFRPGCTMSDYMRYMNCINHLSPSGVSRDQKSFHQISLYDGQMGSMEG